MYLFDLRCSCLYTPSRDVPAIFHIDLHFIANPMYYDSDKFEDLIACCYHTHIYCDSVLITWCFFFSCFSLSVTLTSDSFQHGCCSSWVVQWVCNDFIFICLLTLFFIYIFISKKASDGDIEADICLFSFARSPTTTPILLSFLNGVALIAN